MKIKPNYLYRVLGDLEKEGRVKKKGRQYYPRLELSRYGSAYCFTKRGRPARRAGLFHRCCQPWTQTRPSWLTASRSSRSSATLASIRWREKSGTSSPSTIDHSPPAQVQGKPEMIPSSIP